MGPENIVVALKIEFQKDLSSAQLAEEINRIEADIRQKVPDACKIYIEPDTFETNYHANLESDVAGVG